MRNKKIQFANLVCRSGNYTLLQLFDAFIYPAFFGENLHRTYGTTTYVFHEPKLVNLWESADNSGLAIVGRIVKDERIHIEQRLEEGELKEADESVQNSPSSVFVLFLSNHRMAYVREHSRAPSLQVFETTLEYFVRKIYVMWLRSHLRQIRSNNPRAEWAEKREAFVKEYPRPTVDLVELSDARDIKDVILGMGAVHSLSFDVIRTNDEINASSLFEILRREKVSLGNPAKANVSFRDQKHTLDLQESASLVEAAANDQNVNFTVEGKTGDQSVKYTNKTTDQEDEEKVTITVPLQNENETPIQIAHQAAKVFDEMAEKGVVNSPQMINKPGVISRLADIMKKYLR